MHHDRSRITVAGHPAARFHIEMLPLSDDVHGAGICQASRREMALETLQTMSEDPSSPDGHGSADQWNQTCHLFVKVQVGAAHHW